MSYALSCIDNLKIDAFIHLFEYIMRMYLCHVRAHVDLYYAELFIVTPYCVTVDIVCVEQY